MASLTLHLLTIVLGVVFIFLGQVKLSPQFFPEYHTFARTEFGKFNKEFPFYEQTGWRPLAKNYRTAVGVLEMSAGTLFLLAGVFSQLLANVALLLLMANYLWTFQKGNFPFEYVAGAIGLTVLLLLRLFVASRQKNARPTPTRRKSNEEKVE